MDYFKGNYFTVSNIKGRPESHLHGQTVLAVSEPFDHGSIVIRGDAGTHDLVHVSMLTVVPSASN